MISKGIVVNSTEQDCEVIVYRQEACGSCSACNSCDAKPTIYHVKNTLHLSPGEGAVLEIENKSFFAGIFALYVIPTILFILGVYVVHSMVNNNDLFAFLGGIGGCIVYFPLARILDRFVKKKELIQMIDHYEIDQLNTNEL